jgi:hypothetical protein
VDRAGSTILTRRLGQGPASSQKKTQIDWAFAPAAADAIEGEFNLQGRTLFYDLGAKYSDLQQPIAETSERNATCSVPHRLAPAMTTRRHWDAKIDGSCKMNHAARENQRSS